MSGTAYRVEISPNNRAGCKGNVECKTNRVKIMKGEVRFGTLVTIQDRQSWAYRHWGCVTPKVLQNLNAQCEGDMEFVDGYDELPEEWQEKVKTAIEQEHVNDEDWKGDPEYNRPGMTGFGPKKKKKIAADDDEEDAPAKKGGKKRKQEADNDDDTPASKKTKRKAKPAKDTKADEEKPKKSRAKKLKAQAESEDEIIEEEKLLKLSKRERVTKKAKKQPEPELESEPKDEDESEIESKKPKKAKAQTKKATAYKPSAPKKSV